MPGAFSPFEKRYSIFEKCFNMQTVKKYNEVVIEFENGMAELFEI